MALMGEDILFDLNAASWRHGHADELAYVEALAARLEKSLPDLVRVEREHKLFSKEHPVAKVEVAMEGDTFVLAKEGGRLVARRAKAVRGIVLSTKVVPMMDWLNELSEALNAYVKEHDHARQSLEDFLL